MIAPPSGNVVLTEQAAERIRDEFIAWQCRLRQLSARQMGGRPLEGMCPSVLGHAGEVLSGSVVTVLVEKVPAEHTAQMRFQFMKTGDPVDRYDRILEILQSAYFQHPQNFSDTMCALFGPTHPLAARLLHLRRCVLAFEQYRQCYQFPCTVTALAEDDPSYQATYWHNAMFNPDLPAGIQILAFQPDWSHASEWQRDS